MSPADFLIPYNLLLITKSLSKHYNEACFVLPSLQLFTQSVPITFAIAHQHLSEPRPKSRKDLLRLPFFRNLAAEGNIHRNYTRTYLYVSGNHTGYNIRKQACKLLYVELIPLPEILQCKSINLCVNSVENPPIRRWGEKIPQIASLDSVVLGQPCWPEIVSAGIASWRQTHPPAQSVIKSELHIGLI